jgi:hypothetical protein
MHFIQKHAPFVAERPANAHHLKDPAAHAGRHFLLPRGMPSRSSRSRNFTLVAGWVPLQGRDASPGCRTNAQASAIVAFQPAPGSQASIARNPREAPCPMTAVGSVVDLAPVDCTDNGIACRTHKKEEKTNAATCSAVCGRSEAPARGAIAGAVSRRSRPARVHCGKSRLIQGLERLA